MWLAVAIPGVAMCLGWGLAGQYGGAFGAMIPGVLGALALVLVARRRLGTSQVWAVAMAGALGFGIGGDETYGQTIATCATHRLWLTASWHDAQALRVAGTHRGDTHC